MKPAISILNFMSSTRLSSQQTKRWTPSHCIEAFVGLQTYNWETIECVGEGRACWDATNSKVQNGKFSERTWMLRLTTPRIVNIPIHCSKQSSYQYFDYAASDRVLVFRRMDEVRVLTMHMAADVMGKLCVDFRVNERHVNNKRSGIRYATVWCQSSGHRNHRGTGG